MMRLLGVLGMVLLMAAPASAQITVPNTFVPLSRIVSADVNENFSTIAAAALNRSGGTMTGTLITTNVVPDANNTRDLGASGTRYANVYSVLGNFSGAVTMASTLNVTGNTALAGVAAIGTSTIAGRRLVLGGVGNTSGAVADAGDKGATLLISSTAGGGQDGGGIELGFGLGAYSQPYFSAIRALGVNGADNTTGSLAFFTRAAPTDSSLTKRMEIAPDGTVTVTGRIPSASAQPGFFAYNSASDSTVGNGNTLEFDTELYDTASNYNTSTDTFTAPVTGVYQLCGGLYWDSSGSDVQGFEFVVGGSTVVGQFIEEVLAAGQAHNVSGCVHASLTASDAVTMRFWSFSSEIASVFGVRANYFSARLMP